MQEDGTGDYGLAVEELDEEDGIRNSAYDACLDNGQGAGGAGTGLLPHSGSRGARRRGWLASVVGRSGRGSPRLAALVGLVCLVLLCAFFLLQFGGGGTEEGNETGGGMDHGPAHRVKNVVFMLADGFGMSSVTLARDVAAHVAGMSASRAHMLTLDYLARGSVRTASSTHTVTDSAAAATAYACAEKTYNYAVGVGASGDNCTNVAEAAADAGASIRFGLVVTCRLNHATPAAFTSHMKRRTMYTSIATQQVQLPTLPDVMLGGGACYYLPPSDPRSCRRSDADVDASALPFDPLFSPMTHLEERGYDIVQTADELHAFVDQAKAGTSGTGKLAGFFNDWDMKFAVDRAAADVETEPPLSDMTVAALELLTMDHDDDKGKDGWFLMVEGSRVDHAAHQNDAYAHAFEIIEYDRTVKAVLDFLDEHDLREDTLVVSVADHETGGVSVGADGVYGIDLGRIVAMNASCEHIERTIRATETDTMTDEEKRANRLAIFVAGTSIQESELEAGELDQLATAGLAPEREYMCDGPCPRDFCHTVSQIVRRITHAAFTTPGHTAADVMLYLSTPTEWACSREEARLYEGYETCPASDRNKLAWNVDNTDVGRWIRRVWS